MLSITIGATTLSFDGKTHRLPESSVRIVYGLNQIFAGRINLGDVYSYEKTDLEKQIFDFPILSRYKRPKTIINKHDVKGA